MDDPESLEGPHESWDGDEEPEPGLREFRIIVGEVRGARPVCELRCPECGSPDLVMLPVLVSTGGTRSLANLHGITTAPGDDPAPFVRIPFCCGEEHTFDYVFNVLRGKSRIFVTHSIFEPTEAEGSTM
jgi:hypothetical protein